MLELNWNWYTFENLSVHRLYQLLRLRAEVFVVEQDCVYQDLDNRDQDALHLLAEDNEGNVHACVRLIAPDVAYQGHSAIGRVVTSSSLRGQGQGRPLMLKAIEKAQAIYADTPIKLSGQQHLCAFYESVGFKATGEPYLEDGIPHLAMVLEG